jgi:large subunit ribosomal protein L15
MPIHRRLPKRGFTNIFKKQVSVVNVCDLDRFEAGETVDIDALKQKGMVKNRFDAVKILGDGDIAKALTVKECRVSKSAKEKIESAGGSIAS